MDYFPISIGNNYVFQLTFIFFKGVETTNQFSFIYTKTIMGQYKNVVSIPIMVRVTPFFCGLPSANQTGLKEQ